MDIWCFSKRNVKNFFRPLNRKRRELVVACLHALYERLHGPNADYSQNPTRDALKGLLAPTVQGLINDVAADSRLQPTYLDLDMTVI